jgi:hypothetical protein
VAAGKAAAISGVAADPRRRVPYAVKTVNVLHGLRYRTYPGTGGHDLEISLCSVILASLANQSLRGQNSPVRSWAGARQPDGVRPAT